MSKQYGLITRKKPTAGSGRSNYEATRVNLESKMAIDKALEEDPNIFEYDEIYDDIHDTKKKTQTNADSNEETLKPIRKSKYIESLLVNADKRKVVEERRQDRKIEKEREAEGGKFKDKEVFVTDAYRQKLMERKIYEEREKMERELEDQLDPTKIQEHGMTAFYRNFINQNVGEKVEINLKEKYLDKMTEDLRKQLLSKNADDKELADAGAGFKKSSKSGQSKRQRKSSSSSEEDVVIQSLRKGRERKRHDENSDQKSKEDVIVEKVQPVDHEKVNNTKLTVDKKVDQENDQMKTEKIEDEKSKKEGQVEEDKVLEPLPRLSSKELLTDLFKKRCVGVEFEQAQRRYFERKANY